MEFIIVILETLSKFGSGLSVTLLLAILIALMAYSIKDNMKYRAENDRKLDEIAKEQREMRAEYSFGFEKIEKNLMQQHLDSQKMLDDLQEQQIENQRLTLRGLVTNVSLPREYRLSSFDKYKEIGGNSWLDDYVNEELKSDTK